MAKQETIDIETLIQDQHNFNRGTEEEEAAVPEE